MALSGLMACTATLAQLAAPVPPCTPTPRGQVQTLLATDYAARMSGLVDAHKKALAKDARLPVLASYYRPLASSGPGFNPGAAHQVLSLPDSQQIKVFESAYREAELGLVQSFISPSQQRSVWALAGIEAARMPYGGLVQQPRIPGAEPQLQFRDGRPVIGRRLDPTTMVVGDVDIVPGGLAGAAPGQPYIVVDGGGSRCYRPLEPEDLAIDGTQETTAKLAMNPDGFRQIAMIAKRTDGALLPSCSAVLVGTAGTPEAPVAHLLTAAHCVQTQGPPSGNPNDFVPHPSLVADFRILLPRESMPATGRDRLAGCLDPVASPACAFRVGTIDEPAHVQPGVGIGSPWMSAPIQVPIPDIALLRVRFNAGVLPPPAEVRVYDSAPAGPRPFWLVQGGYGIGPKVQGNLAVVPWVALQAPAPNNLGFVKLNHAEQVFAHSHACSGDSGGPLFQRSDWGHPAERNRPVAALVSAVVDGGTVDGCKHSTYQLVQTITPEIKRWLCKKESTINGCSTP